MLSVVVEAFQAEHLHEHAGKNTATRWLAVCVKKGFLESQSGQHEYHWVHDKIQEAALALEDPEKLARIQVFVGSVLFRYLGGLEIAQNIFVITNLVNQQM